MLTDIILLLFHEFGRMLQIFLAISPSCYLKRCLLKVFGLIGYMTGIVVIPCVPAWHLNLSLLSRYSFGLGHM